MTGSTREQNVSFTEFSEWMSSTEMWMRFTLEEYCDANVKYFSLVLVLDPGAKEPYKRYICLCRRSFYMIDRLKSKNQYYYGNIESVVMDSVNQELLAIKAKEKPTIYIKSPVRFEILKYLRILWKTDYMTRFQRVGYFPLTTEEVRLPEILQPFAIMEENIVPTPETKVCYCGNYQFLMPNEFETDEKLTMEDELLRYRQDIQKIYRHPEGHTLKVLIQIPHKILKKGSRRDAYALQVISEKLAHEETGDDQGMIIFSDIYTKKNNVSGDVASWRCHQIHLRTLRHEYGILLVRRKYIPPFADITQDISFVLCREKGDEPYSTDQFMKPLRRIVDSATPNQQSFFFDEDVIQTRVTGLNCDEESMNWYGSHISLYPTIIDAVKALIKSMAFFLYSEKIDIVAEQIYHTMPLFEDFFEILVDLDGDYQARTGNSATADNMSWKTKVARYVANCIDGGLVTSLSLEDMVVCSKQPTTSSKGLEKIHRFMDYLIHLKPENERFEYIGLLAKIANGPIFLKSTFNERVVCRLLQLGYFDAYLTPHDMYVSFLVLLLEKGGSNELMEAVCMQISFACSNEEKTRKLVSAGILSHLLKLLYETDSLILISASKALVNMSSRLDSVKEALINEHDIGSLLVRHLSQKNVSLATYCAKIIKNCATWKDAKLKEPTDIPVLQSLLSLLQSWRISYDEELLSACASAIWNLGRDNETTTKLLSIGAVAVLSDILSAAENSVVLEKVAGAIMVIAANSKESRQEFYSKGGLLKLSDVFLKSSDKGVIRSSLSALFYLSKEKKNAKAMVSRGIHPGLNRALSILGEKGTELVEKFRANLNDLD